MAKSNTNEAEMLQPQKAVNPYHSNGATSKEPKKLIVGVFAEKKNVLLLKHQGELIFPTAKNGPAHSQNLIADAMSVKTGLTFLPDKKAGKVDHKDARGFINAEIYLMKNKSNSLDSLSDKCVMANIKNLAKTGFYEKMKLSPLTQSALQKLIKDGHL